MSGPPPTPTLFPYTTLFRSVRHEDDAAGRGDRGRCRRGRRGRARHETEEQRDRKSTRLNSSHEWISYAVFCLKKKKQNACDKDAEEGSDEGGDAESRRWRPP